MRTDKLVAAMLVSAAMLGCAGFNRSTENSTGHDAPQASAVVRAWAATHLSTPARVSGWDTLAFPGKRAAAFEPTEVLLRPALRVRANSSVSILRQRFEPMLPAVGRLSLSWKIDGLPDGADLSNAALADSPVRLVLAFEGDRSRWSPRMHRLSELSRLLTGEELPYATLIYVWSATDPVDTVLKNPRTDRIRKVVLDSGSERVGQWRDHVRDVRADFRRAFGEKPGPLRQIALMTDTDNTRSSLTAWYGPLSLELAQD
ncbi:DUF3047 domain-containing protein [Hydrogenophaga sp.]|uniref:DUF3047 domain-containing protein n=1 Tax=Hydrogenophaga sp. TaxID=1904254 RepID=UPI00261E7F7D|nr:DUF3047 domain-containing protein [Hydrogenophaga sp.]MCW5655666.1 DUF3047 domain-containing protein [Hydrogenophaga sp.]